MATSSSHTTTPPAQAAAPVSNAHWVDTICVGPCAEVFKAHPVLHRWRGVIAIYVIISALVILHLIYKSLTRRLAMGPEAPAAPVREKRLEKPLSPKKEAPVSAPRSPKARVAKKVAAAVEEPAPAPVASPKARKPRKSVSPTTTTKAAETVAPVAPYALFSPLSPLLLHRYHY